MTTSFVWIAIVCGAFCTTGWIALFSHVINEIDRQRTWIAEQRAQTDRQRKQSAACRASGGVPLLNPEGGVSCLRNAREEAP